jgi:hypothetical protein
LVGVLAGDLSVSRDQRPAIDLKEFRAQIDECFAGSGTHSMKLNGHVGCRAAAKSSHVKRRQLRIGHDQRIEATGACSSSATAWVSEVRIFWPTSTCR